MDWRDLFPTFFWIAVVVYVWRTARRIENTRLGGQRPRHDTPRLIGFAVLFASGFALVLFLIGRTALAGLWMVAGVDVLGSVIVVSATYLMFSLGLALARRGERIPLRNAFVDAAKFIAAAIGYIGAMLCVFLIMDRFAFDREGPAWVATTAIMVGALTAWMVIRDRIRRRSDRPAKQGHAK